MSSDTTNQAFESRSRQRDHMQQTSNRTGIAPYLAFLAAAPVASILMFEPLVGDSGIYLLVFLPVIPLTLIYATIAHMLLNAFHTLSARVFGFHIETLAIGPLQIVDQGRVEQQFTHNWRGFGASSIIAPASYSQGLRCLLFLLLDALFLGVFTLFGLLASRAMIGLGIPSPIVSLFVVSFGLVTGIIALALTLTLAVKSSIYVFVPRKPVNAWYCGLICEELAAIPSTDLINTRPRDWPTELVQEQAIIHRSRSNKEMSEALVQAYYHFLDAGDSEKAGTYIDQAVALTGTFGRFAHPRVHPESAYYFARCRKNPRAARARLEQAHKLDARPHVVLRAEAAIALEEGDLEAARAKAMESLKRLDRASPPGIALAEREWLASLVQDIGMANGAVHIEERC